MTITPAQIPIGSVKRLRGFVRRSGRLLCSLATRLLFTAMNSTAMSMDASQMSKIVVQTFVQKSDPTPATCTGVHNLLITMATSKQVSATNVERVNVPAKAKTQMKIAKPYPTIIQRRIQPGISNIMRLMSNARFAIIGNAKSGPSPQHRKIADAYPA